MFIVWGKKYVYRNLGYVADLCKMCGDIKPFQLRRVGLASHVYYVTTSQGDFVQNEGVCTSCKTVVATDIRKYAAIGRDMAPVAELVPNTYPGLPAIAADFLALKEKARSNPAQLTPSQRQDMLAAPFLMLSPKVEAYYSSVKLDKVVGWSMLGVVGSLMIVPAVLSALMPGKPEGLLIYFALCAVFILWQMAFVGRRYVRGQIVPQLADALRPLKPSAGEVRTILDSLRKHKHKLGEKLTPAELLDYLKTTPPAA